MTGAAAAPGSTPPAPRYRLGVDTGGTFTDFVVLGPEGLQVHKTPSTPADPSQAVLRGLAEIFGPSLPPLEIIHGTTVGTNAFLERRGARVLLLTTAGFEDIIFIGRQTRPHLFALTGEKPPPLLPRERCLGVRERLRADGSVLLPLSDRETDRLRRQVRDLHPQALAICLLHAYANPVHENLLAGALAQLGLPVSLSSQVLPEIREFERTATTLINAYLGPVVGRYLAELERRLPGAALQLQQSNGGFLPARLAGSQAVHTILSGPAGGVNAAWQLGQALGQTRLLTFDMGGTSTDAALMDGAIPYTTEYCIDGFPIGIPMIDITTVGAGGGSLAWQDRGGALRVGPASAGAQPGPVCYGAGGEVVTVTDANLWLGRLLPGYFLGGRQTLHPESTRRAMARLARDFAVSPAELALGIIRVANSTMAKALRAVSLERGYDPRDFTLVCFGGAGGLHVCELARELQIRRIVIPTHTGVFSALGMAGARPRRDFVKSLVGETSGLSWASLAGEMAQLQKHAAATLAQEGLGGKIDFQASLEVRYLGQSYTLNVPWEKDFVNSFHRRHQQTYGHDFADHPLEITTLRLQCTGEAGEVAWLAHAQPAPQPHRQISATVPVWLAQGEKTIPVRWRGALAPHQVFTGPVLILEDLATLLVLPGFEGWADDWGHLHLRDRDGKTEARLLHPHIP